MYEFVQRYKNGLPQKGLTNQLLQFNVVIEPSCIILYIIL